MSSTSAVDMILRSLAAHSTSSTTPAPPSHSDVSTLPHTRSIPHLPTQATAGSRLGSLDAATASSSSSSAATSIKSLLVTLHFFFPHELLPALDLLDRRVLTCLTSSSDGPSANLEVWYVQSASAVMESSSRGAGGQGGRYRNAMRATNTHYEVRLDSWNCSCAGFAFSCFTLLNTVGEKGREGLVEGQSGEERTGGEGNEDWAFGRTATRKGTGVPVCKHILAAVLAKAAPELFADAVARREVSREEMAGWGAGWGDYG